jgi:hypothetical protein
MFIVAVAGAEFRGTGPLKRPGRGSTRNRDTPPGHLAEIV